MDSVDEEKLIPNGRGVLYLWVSVIVVLFLSASIFVKGKGLDHWQFIFSLI